MADDGREEKGALARCSGEDEERATSSSPPSLQEAFKLFREKKRRELREATAAAQGNERTGESDAATLERLRCKFLQTVLSYCGVPYARRYHEPESPTYNSPLFLDCCGLVRRVLRDMKEELGFSVGPWNQAYQYDTLPMVLSGPEEMRAGDLVFISATYFNKPRKPQRHDMVHVEIWLGEGEKTIGARWQKGRFVSKSYHNMQYHFRSIETWLSGVCQSFCPEHEWKVRKFDPGKYSIFLLTEQDESCGEEEEEEDEGKEGGGGGGGGGGDENEQDKEEEEEEVKVKIEEETTSPQKPLSTSTPLPIKPLMFSPPSRQYQPPSSAVKKRSPIRQMSSRGAGRGGIARTFITSGGNAAHLVSEALRGKGWVKLDDPSSTAFTLKWAETSKQINYKEFRQGEQMVNHFPNISLLTTKIGLLESLRAIQRLQSSSGAKGPKVAAFLLETFRLDREDERVEFTRIYTDEELWICKPTGANQGKGIFIVRELQQVMDRLESDQRNCKIASRPTARIVQRYITPPLLLGGRKFDIRVYLLVVGARTYVVLYADGYVRLSCASYNAASSDPTVHLTNQAQQKKHPEYTSMRDDTVWDYAKLQDQLSREHGLPDDWVSTTLTRRMKAIMSTCFQSVRHKLTHRIGCFDLLGFDFMLDSNHNVWLIEVNVNPALHTNCTTLQSLVPPLVSETLDVAIEIFDKCRRNKPIFPLSSTSLFSPIVTS